LDILTNDAAEHLFQIRTANVGDPAGAIPFESQSLFHKVSFTSLRMLGK